MLCEPLKIPLKTTATAKFSQFGCHHHDEQPVMAAQNAPKHDFAPAWLKIPMQENPKPSGSKPTDSSDKNRSRSHKDDSFRYGPDYARLHRQHSFENYYDSKRSGATGKYRHHSVEDDYYSYPYGAYGPYYNGYGPPPPSMQYSSQPSVFRSPSREGKYPPNMRYGQMNGAYPGYYDLYQFDYYHGDPYYAGYPSNSRAASKRSHYEREGRSNSKEGKEKDGEKGGKSTDDDKDKPNLQEDFVNHPPHGKGMTKFGERGQAASIYKSLVPNKGSLNRKSSKEGIRLNGGFSKDSPYSSNKSPSGKETSRLSPTPPMDILNTRLVTQPRNLGDKKSQFLKALRKENANNNEESNGDNKNNRHGKSYKDDIEGLRNGVDSIDVSSNNVLSSSLEAEQRLLRAMGWNELDEEEYEITEDDKKKFQDLCSKQVKQHKNDRLPKTLSPKHIPVYQPNELNDTLSSSDSDSDDCSQ
ncbi:hypothetical protein KUTeg_016283 [Tegillarca granosa]|uniref:Vasculin n=1 Tax=Tegillarca granosa TaxID=220873 RepID=A0ABQ9EKE9_TEGGR|nr:hypothetical protein KUTeg_016283 [Tegillarca granosa]